MASNSSAGRETAVKKVNAIGAQMSAKDDGYETNRAKAKDVNGKVKAAVGHTSPAGDGMAQVKGKNKDIKTNVSKAGVNAVRDSLAMSPSSRPLSKTKGSAAKPAKKTMGSAVKKSGKK